MKRTLMILMITAALVSLFVTGCGDSKPAAPKNASAPVESKELKLAYTVTFDGTDGLALQKFSELFKEQTGGKYTIKHFPSSQLGSEREITEAMQIGTIDMVFTGFAPVSWYAPQYECLDAPFVVTGYKHMDMIYKTDVIKEVNDALLKAKGMRVLDYYYRGPRYVTSNKEIKSASDMKGYKIRVPETPLFIEAFKLLGANPTPISFKELFLSLKQGIVDGQENPLELIYTNSFYEVQKYVIKTEHIFSTHILMINDKLFGTLSAEHQKVLQNAALKCGEYEYELLLKSEKEYEQKLKGKGMKFIDVDRDSFKAVLGKNFADKFTAKWKPGFYEKVTSLK